MLSLKFTPEELQAIRKEYAAGASDSQFTIFISECERRNLVPGRHVVFQSRRAKEWDSDTKSYQWVSKHVYITTISALLLIAQRTGEYEGQGRGKYLYVPGPDDTTDREFLESTVPLPDPNNPRLPRTPWVAEATVYRKGFREPMVGVARFEAYAAYQSSDNGGERRLTQTWSTRGSEQLLKCATAAALRSAFVEETSGLYLTEEIRNDEDDQPKVNVGVTPASVVPLPPPVPPVCQIPASPKDAPRPGHPKAVESVEVVVSPAVEYHAPSVPAVLPEHAGETLVVTSPNGDKPESNPTVTKRTRKKADPAPSPVNGQDGITDEDLSAIGTPAPEFDEAANQKAAAEFVEGTDPTPTKEELAGFSARVRVLVDKKGMKSDEVKKRLLDKAGKTDPKQLTIRDWKLGLEELENQQPPTE